MKKLFFLALFVAFQITLKAQSTDDYRTIASGAWTTLATWQRYDGSNWVAATSTPTSLNGVITVQNGHTVTVGAITVDQVVVDVGGEIDATGNFTIANGSGVDLQVNGYFKNTGQIIVDASAQVQVSGTLEVGAGGTFNTTGTYLFQAGSLCLYNRNGGTFVVETKVTWDATATFKVVGPTSNLPANIDKQAYGNFTWDCTGQTANMNLTAQFTSVAGNFSILSTGGGIRELHIGETNNSTLTVGGDFIQSGGILQMTSSGDRIMNVAGNFSFSGGTIDMKAGNGPMVINVSGNCSLSGTGVLDFGSASAGASSLNVKGDFSHTAGTIKITSATTVGSINFNGTAIQNYTSGGTITNAVNFTVATGSILYMGTSLLGNGSTGTFTLSSGGTLGIGDPAGITGSGASGNVRVTGTRTYPATANYVYNGSAPQTPGSGLPATVNNFTVDNSSGVTLTAPLVVSGNLTINSAGKLIIPVSNDVTVNGTVTNSGGATGLLIQDGGSLIYASGTPSGTAERLITVNSGNYHFLSSPVSSTTFGSVFPINQDKIWGQVYDEPTGTWVNKTYLDNLIPGVGYSMWVDPSLPNQTAYFSGTFNSNGVSFTLSNLNGGVDPNLVGWNLLGNPYTSAIDWDNGGWHGGAGIDGSVYTWNGSNYLTWNGAGGSLTGGVIPAQNGFFVKTTVNGTVITIPYSARVHSSLPLYKEAVPELLHLNITGNNYTDDTYIQYTPGATAGFDHTGDAYKLWGITEAPQLYSIIPGDVLSINALPSVAASPEVSLGLKVGVATTYTITADGLESFDLSVPIRLDDLKLGTSTDLRTNPVYIFTAAPGNAENRFLLRFHAPNSIMQLPSANISIYAARQQIVLNNAGNNQGTFYVYNITGQLLTSLQMQPGKQYVSSLPAGVYIVKADTGKTIISRKVVLQ